MVASESELCEGIYQGGDEGIDSSEKLHSMPTE